MIIPKRLEVSYISLIATLDAEVQKLAAAGAGVGKGARAHDAHAVGERVLQRQEALRDLADGVGRARPQRRGRPGRRQ